MINTHKCHWKTLGKYISKITGIESVPTIRKIGYLIRHPKNAISKRIQTRIYWFISPFQGLLSNYFSLFVSIEIVLVLWMKMIPSSPLNINFHCDYVQLFVFLYIEFDWYKVCWLACIMLKLNTSHLTRNSFLELAEKRIMFLIK